ncbi:uncharacterized protein JCM15063_002822 [Sporobolomyces koalae]|uniref:uncharacterized protein n=1 Tax=Sporobolomyces koalae TaxID=500713 RepID=UPI0031794B4C
MDVQASLAKPDPLPQEIIALILRSSDLNHASLARCCLVSRHTLEPARRNLYFSVDLVLLPRWTRNCRGDVLEDVMYNVTTAALMLTLSTSPHLAAHVRRVALVHNHSDRDYSHVSTTPEATLRTILRYAPRTEHFKTNIGILFGLASQVERGQLDAIRSLDLVKSAASDPTLSFKLNLRRFSINESAFIDWDEERQLPTKLESFTMRPDFPMNRRPHLPHLLRKSMFTLTHLSIPFDMLAAFKNPSFPALVKLELWILSATYDQSEVVAYEALLHKLSNLRILSLRIASDVFFRSPLRLFATKPESLRRIELLREISLDHLAVILTHPVEERIKEIGIYDPSMLSTRDSESTTVRFAAIRQMCHAARVELVLIPPPPP